MDIPVDARAEATACLESKFAVRVLEPSPPSSRDPAWFADDPVNVPVDVGDDRHVVSPVANGDVTWDELASDDADLAAWCADRWLGAWRPLAPIDDVDALVCTRIGWHAIAERVLAPARHRANGKIGLRFTSGGFGTPWFRGPDGIDVQLRVDGTDLLVVHTTGVDRTPLPSVLASPGRTYSNLLTPERDGGEDEDLGYETTTVLTDEVVARVDATSAGLLGDWFGFGCSVLEELRAGSPDAADTRAQIWPEHFDLAVELGGSATSPGIRAAFGASPGDAAHPEPYLYVSPWADAGNDPYWNETAFPGASLPYTALTGDPQAARARALDFLRTGKAMLAGA